MLDLVEELRMDALNAITDSHVAFPIKELFEQYGFTYVFHYRFYARIAIHESNTPDSQFV